MTDYSLTMSRLHADKQWSINGNDYESLIMHDDNSKPSKKSLDDAWPKVQAEIAAEAAAAEAAAASGRAKLAALGLTDDEINALVGA